MKLFRAVVAVALMMGVAACTATTEPKVPPSASTLAVPAAEKFSIIQYSGANPSRVFVFVSEDGYAQFAQSTGRATPAENDPVGMDLSRKQAVMVLGNEKTTDLDAKLTIEKAVKAQYFLTTDGRVGALLQSLR